MTSPKELSLEFVRAFCDADVDRIASLLTDEFRLSGPFLRADSREEYIQSLRDRPPETGGEFELLQSFEAEDDTCLIYEYSRSGSSVLIAQWTRCDAGKIAEMWLIFDSRPAGSTR